MITEKELNPNEIILTREQWDNFLRLYFAINEFRNAYGKPMRVNSGVRSPSEHEEIYKIINIRRKKQGFPSVKTPHRSAHLQAAAVDIADPIGEVYEFSLANESLLIRLSLYLEIKAFTPTWTHFQITPTSKRFFKP